MGNEGVMPPTMHPTDAALQAISDCREHALFTRHAVERLHELVIGDQASPSYHHFRFTSAKLKFDWHNRTKVPTRSFAIYNPSPVTVYVGVGGASATAAAEAIAVPPTSMVVVPLQLGNVEEVGVDPADAAAVALLATGDAVVFAWRYPSVQAAFLGKGV